MTGSPITKAPETFYRVEVSDRDGQIVAIEPAMLAGRAIGEPEEKALRAASDSLTGFIGRRSYDSLARELERTKRNKCEHCGSDRIYSGPPECSGCGAPICCQTCCAMATLETERDSLREALQMLTDEVSAIVAFDADESLQSKIHRARAALKPSNEVGT